MTNKVTMLELDIALASNDDLETMLDHLLSKGYSGDAVEKVITEMARRNMPLHKQGVSK